MKKEFTRGSSRHRSSASRSSARQAGQPTVPGSRQEVTYISAAAIGLTSWRGGGGLGGPSGAASVVAATAIVFPWLLQAASSIPLLLPLQRMTMIEVVVNKLEQQLKT